MDAQGNALHKGGQGQLLQSALGGSTNEQRNENSLLGVFNDWVL